MNQHFFVSVPPVSAALKMAIAIAIGMLIGMERKWSHKETGIRTFAIVALLGMLASEVGEAFELAGLAGVLLLVGFANYRSLKTEASLELTTSAVLMVAYILGVLVGRGHIFMPVAAAIMVTMLLALKQELNRFAGGLKPAEIKSAILLGLIGFVIYPVMPDRYIDPWQLLNPADAWISVIAIAGIAFVNYVCLRLFSTNGLYLGAVFGGLINSSATVAEISSNAKKSGMTSRLTSLVLITTMAMFARNLLLVVLFSPASLASVLMPLAAMMIVSACWLWMDQRQETSTTEERITPQLDSPISLKKILWFGLLFVLIAIGGTLLTRLFGNYGMMVTGFFGGLVSSASTTTAAATMASHGKISAAIAGSVAIISSLASAAVNLPIIWKTAKDKLVTRRLIVEMITVLTVGITVVFLDRTFEISEWLLKNVH
ncbi:MAG: MgtC/SapB family protein [Bacteroidetes bacterium]|nr:MgtC/SapB family protein [Bacteroidota bacterium]